MNMNFMKKIQLIEKLTPFADEIIKHYNDKNDKFKPSNQAIFDEHSETILEIVSGAGIEADYIDGQVNIELDN